MPRAPIRPLPTREELVGLFLYDSQTGALWWRDDVRGCKVKAGDVAGHIQKRGGYRIVRFGGQGYLAHRVIWKMMTGEDPQDQIDHVDGNKANNGWSNLRPADHSTNRQNSRRPKNNNSGFKGVCWAKSHKALAAYIGLGKKQIRLGRFKSLEEAIAVRTAAAKTLHGEFARFG